MKRHELKEIIKSVIKENSDDVLVKLNGDIETAQNSLKKYIPKLKALKQDSDSYGNLESKDMKRLIAAIESGDVLEASDILSGY